MQEKYNYCTADKLLAWIDIPQSIAYIEYLIRKWE